MATVSLAANAYPVFGSINYVNNETKTYGTFTASENQSLLHRVLDGDRFSYYHGSSTSDVTVVTLIFSFQNKTAVISRTPDVFAFLNINWKRFTVKSSTDGVTYNVITGFDYSASDYADDNIIVNVAAGLAAKYIKVEVTSTQVANEQKKLGSVMIFASKFQSANGMLNYKPLQAPRGNLRAQIMADGTERREYVKYSAASHKFYGASFEMPIASAAELASLRELERDGLPICFIAQPGDLPEEAALVWLDGDFDAPYESPLWSAGYRLTIKVRAVGRF